MDQTILAVDDNGKFLEYISKESGHKGIGRRHLAITVLLFNSKGQVLLQKRKHKIFDNIWDFTGATHPLHKPHFCHSERSEESPDSNLEIATSPTAPRNDKKCECIDESLEEATWRCLEKEYGIQKKMELKNLGFFNYFAKYGDYCENEYCAMMMGEYDGKINLDPEVGYEYKWMDKKEFLSDVESNPDKYVPWVIEGIKVLKQAEFFRQFDLDIIDI